MIARKFIRRWRAPAQLMAAMGAIVVFVKTQALPYLVDKDSGPAWVIHRMDLESGFPGEYKRIFMEVDKIRPCQPKTGSLTIVDSGGNTFVVEHNVGSHPLPMGSGQKVMFNWRIPLGISPGIVASGHFEIWHHECQKGNDPTGPAIFETNAPKIQGAASGNPGNM